MSGTLLVRGARQLITLRGPGEPRRGADLNELGIIRDGALLIEDGRIKAWREYFDLAPARAAYESA